MNILSFFILDFFNVTSANTLIINEIENRKEDAGAKTHVVWIDLLYFRIAASIFHIKAAMILSNPILIIIRNASYTISLSLSAHG